jgi:hypothetical protein
MKSRKEYAKEHFMDGTNGTDVKNVADKIERER